MGGKSSAKTDRTLISVVSPAHNEEKNLPLMYSEIAAVFAKETKYDFEYIIVNDGSTDDTWEIIKDLCSKCGNIRGINLSRNFGHQIALTAGLDRASGAAVIYCDSDLQHPPSIFPELIRKWEDGYKIVHTFRKYTKGEPILKKLFSEFFYKVLNIFTEYPVKKGFADFKLLDNSVLKELKSMREHNRFLRGLVPWMGYRSAVVSFVARERVYGKPWYNFRRNLTFAKLGILSLSSKPLKFIGYIGIALIGFSLLLLSYNFIYFIRSKEWLFSPTFALSVFNTLLNGILLSSLGIVALYLSCIYVEVIDRPIYIVDEEV